MPTPSTTPADEPQVRPPGLGSPRSVAEHRMAVLDLLAAGFRERPQAAEDEFLISARGRVLAADVAAPGSLPPFANSQMDGYAVHSADLATSGQPGKRVELAVAATIPAGFEPPALVRGTAAPIMTGAMLPPGADAVVPIEQAVPDSFPSAVGSPAVEALPRATVSLPAGVPAGQYVRSAGSDIRAGDPALPAGTVLGPGQLGLLAALGVDAVRVRARPRVLLLTTGDEVVEPGLPLQPGQIHDANTTLLRSLLEEAGATVLRTRVLADSPQEFQHRLHEDLAAEAPDLIITSGGISKGAFEVVKQGLGREDVEFLSVAMQPGGPQGIGRVAGIPFLAFPGNPVSCVVSFEMFLRPALGSVTGLPRPRPELTALLTADVHSPAGKHQVRRGRYLPPAEPGSTGQVELVGGPSSHLVHALATSNALVHLPAGRESFPAGAEVTVWLLDR
ncbi:molybdopterin molybdotransferase MoeA [Arthrobacter sp. zg-Y809]|uniref:Molybdopterin molybdenumtransferase n=1 Tax=Arthrobacter gengyunqii TaxID=2886940 RepID=A0A9X1S6H4_9MICC|nr:molybdopterin molybdotransferase MoeA [Arthrobacter gengyunqii]